MGTWVIGRVLGESSDAYMRIRLITGSTQWRTVMQLLEEPLM
jgi:hypothetical protein